MKIAVLSGKGGTGKTFVSVNLAAVSGSVAYLDCDVEEPNGALFLKPLIDHTETVEVLVPIVDAGKCSGCRICVDFCKFNALAYVKDALRIFPEICHGCEGCIHLCPEQALSKGFRPVGRIESGSAGQIRVSTGILDVGQVTGVPIIKKMVAAIKELGDTIIDCPPGSACVVMESIREADYCLLVAENTAFGIHNLQMVHQLVSLFQKPHGLILNKSMGSSDALDRYCGERKIPILARIPFDASAGKALARGTVLASEDAGYEELFKGVLRDIQREVPHEPVGCPQR